MKKYYVQRLIFSTPAGRRHLHDSFGVLWKLSRDGFLYIHLWIVWARARFSYGTRLALMIPRRNQHSGLMGFGMNPSVLWTSDVPGHLHTQDPMSSPSRNPHDKASVRKLSSVCTYTQWVPMLSFPRNDGHGELLPHPDSPISISGPTECLLLSLRLCWFILTLHTWMCVNLEITWTLCSAMVWMRGARESLMWKPPERESESTS